MAYQRGRSHEEKLTDPLNAPSVRGQHPHMIRSNQDRTGDQSVMYEARGKFGQYNPLPQINPTKRVEASAADGSLTNTLLLLGVAGLAVYAIMQASKARDEARTRRNPGDGAAPPYSSVVVMQPALAALPPAGAASIAPAAVEAAPATARRVDIPQPVQDAVLAAPSTPARPKKRRTRQTTQARDPKTGTYLPAGTRRKKHIEGDKA